MVKAEKHVHSNRDQRKWVTNTYSSSDQAQCLNTNIRLQKLPHSSVRNGKDIAGKRKFQISQALSQSLCPCPLAGDRILGHSSLWSNLGCQLLCSHVICYSSKTCAALYWSLSRFHCLLLQWATGRVPSLTISCILQTISQCKTNRLCTMHTPVNIMETKESPRVLFEFHILWRHKGHEGHKLPAWEVFNIPSLP